MKNVNRVRNRNKGSGEKVCATDGAPFYSLLGDSSPSVTSSLASNDAKYKGEILEIV